jgi:hypothetical protein
VLYFPVGLLKNEFLRFRDAVGDAQSFTVTGERKHGRGERASTFRYHTAPVFAPIGSPTEGYELILRIRVRLTDTNGVPFPGHSGNSRRKKLCKGWWNADWLNRIAGVMQFLAGGEDQITIGDSPSDHILIESRPRTWEAPVRLNEEAITVTQTEIEKDFVRIFGDDDDEDSDD